MTGSHCSREANIRAWHTWRLPVDTLCNSFRSRDEELATSARDAPFRLESTENDRHRLPRAADEVGQLLMRQLHPQADSVLAVDPVLFRQFQEQVYEPVTI